MQAGRLRHLISLQRPGGSRDQSTGQRTTTWTTVTTAFAAIEPLSGREQFLSAQRLASTTHQITLRYSAALSALNASWRIIFGAVAADGEPAAGSRVFTIDAPPRNIDERDIQFVLSCTEGRRQE